MNPNLLNRAPSAGAGSAKPASLRSGAFVRMIRIVIPHRSLLGVGIIASILYALLHSVSILGALPILKILLEEEGLHGWVDRAVAGTRIDAFLSVREDGMDENPSSILVVQDVDRGSPTQRAGLRPGDRITALNNERFEPRRLLTRLAEGQENERVVLEVTAAGDDSSRTIEITLSPPSRPWRLGRFAASLVPRESTRDDRLATLTYVLCAVVFLVIIANGCRFVSQYFIGLGVLRAMMDLRRTLYAKVLRLPMSRFTRDVGDIVSRLVQDIQDIQRGVMSLFGKTIREPLRALFILAAALMMDWRITLTMIVVGPVAVVIFWRVGASLKKANKKLLRGYGSMVSALSGTLSTIGVIKAYTSENVERRRLWEIDRRMFHQQTRILRLESILSPALEVLGIVGASAVTVWLGARVIARDIEPAKFGALIIVLAMMFDPLRKMADVYARILKSSAGADRVFEILDAEDETDLQEGTLTLEPLKSEIEFRNVTLVYPEAERPALDRVSLTVKRGETVALVGPNGAGKTTLVNMLARFYDPQDGEILFDGHDIRTVNLKTLRKQIGLVAQDTVVFPIPLADNIAYGARNGSRDTVIQAAKRAYADEFIRHQPQGYDTIPGDMGKALSGGERQRIAIARAVFRDAPILIFDEATSQIDSESEQKIQTALKEFAQGRTTFIIAHRLSTIQFASRIIVMDAGRIVDTGTHRELLERCPLYHGLCETQLLA